MSTPQWAAMGVDAPNVFDREFFLGMSAIVDEHVMRDGPEEGIKVVWVVTLRSDVDPAWAREHWRRVHGPLALRASGITRYVQNHAVEAVCPAGTDPVKLKFSGLSECWFPDAETCRKRSHRRRGTTSAKTAWHSSTTAANSTPSTRPQGQSMRAATSETASPSSGLESTAS